jgi:hypothetical protein
MEGPLALRQLIARMRIEIACPAALEPVVRNIVNR